MTIYCYHTYNLGEFVRRRRGAACRWSGARGGAEGSGTRPSGPSQTLAGPVHFLAADINIHMT
ncbi:hypothetical protein E2C01_033519 [Portunus trituberculatus]|uniref:Uncharacterized protein n=1 Tax=Portunus trituberculatus TaxID=210409 RepID=A0A5B7F3M7_PORTR|nr:hypothetical protein [Portunus trituberculatus]